MKKVLIYTLVIYFFVNIRISAAKDYTEKELDEIFGIASSGETKYYGKEIQKKAQNTIIGLKDKSAGFLVKKLNSKSAREIISAMEFLGKMGKECTPYLVYAAENPDTHSTIVSRIIAVFEKTKDNRAVKTVYSKLDTTNARIKRAAISALAVFGEKSAIPEMIKALNDENPAIVRASISALGKLDAESAIPDLVKMLDDERYSIRYPAALVLTNFRGKAVEELLDYLPKSGKLAKYQIVECFGKIKDKRAVEPLINMLSDQDWALRAFCVEALISIGEEKGINEIIKMESIETNGFVIEKIREILDSRK